MTPSDSSLSPALIAAYRAARYVVDGPRFILNVDRVSPELLGLYRRYGKSQAAYLTACNPGGTLMAPEDNLIRTATLACELKATEHLPLTGHGEDPRGQWPDEPSFLMLGMSEAEACAIAQRHGQNALLHVNADGIPRLLLLR